MSLASDSLALVRYLRNAETKYGIFNSVHGGIVIVFPHEIDPLIAAVEDDLITDSAAELTLSVGAPVLQPAPKVVPVTANAAMSGRAVTSHS